MAEAFGSLLSPALGVALSPFPIVGIILILSATDARLKGLAFLTGWIVGLAALVGALVVISERIGIDREDNAPSTLASVVRLLLGTGLVLLAVKTWRSRPAADETPPMPGWMSSIASASAGGALRTGAMLAALNPKNLLFNMLASTAIASSGVEGIEEVFAWLIFVLLASTSVIVPVAWYLVAPEVAAARLEGPRRWFIQHSSAIVAVILLAIGVSQIGDAITALGS